MNITFWMRLALLFVRRSWRSTIVLGTMVAFAVAALIFLAALAVGTNDTMVRNSVGLFSGHIAGTDLPANLSADRLSVRGVKGVLVRRSMSARLRHGQDMEAVELIGVDPDKEAALTALPRKLIEGRFVRAGERGVVLSEGVARVLKARAGDSIGYGVKPGAPVGALTVTGVYRTGVAYLDERLALCPAAALPPGSAAVSAAIFLKDGVDAEGVVRVYRAMFGAGAFHAWTEFMPDLKQLIDLNFVSMAVVMVLVFAVAALSISCAFVIFALKNLREAGIMKAMGVLPCELACLLTSQIVVVTLAASIAGVAAGMIAAAAFAHTGLDLAAFTSHNRYFAVSGIIYPRLTAFSLWLPPVLALVFALLAAVWPSVFIVRKKAAEILRQA